MSKLSDRAKLKPGVKVEIIEYAESGVVVDVLSAQFVYKTTEGHIRYCLFNQKWKLK